MYICMLAVSDSVFQSDVLNYGGDKNYIKTTAS